MPLSVADFTGQDAEAVKYYLSLLEALKKFTDEGYYRELQAQKLSLDIETYAQELEGRIYVGEQLAQSLQWFANLPYEMKQDLNCANAIKEDSAEHVSLAFDAVDIWRAETGTILASCSDKGISDKAYKAFIKPYKYEVLTAPARNANYAESLDKLREGMEVVEGLREQLRGNNKISTITSDTVTADIKLVDATVSLWLQGVEQLTLRQLRVDGAEYNFINFVLARPNTNISRGDVQTLIEGCATKDDLTEIVRYCGFNKSLKKLFFPTCSQLRVMFRPSVQISRSQAEELVANYKS